MSKQVPVFGSLAPTQYGLIIVTATLLVWVKKSLQNQVVQLAANEKQQLTGHHEYRYKEGYPIATMQTFE